MDIPRVSSSSPALNGILDIRIEDLAEADLDRLPVGVIRLDRRGVVLSYNAYEERRAGRARQDVIGKDFFHEIAPCTQVSEFHGRFLAGVEAGELDVTFGFVFPFPRGDRHVFVTLFYQSADSSIWVILRDTDRSGPRRAERASRA